MVALIDRELGLAKVTKELAADSDAVDKMVATVVKRFDRLDILLNNAGFREGGESGAIRTDQWRKVMATDVDSLFFGCRSALPHLEKPKAWSSTPPRPREPAVIGNGPHKAAKGTAVNQTRALATAGRTC